MDKKSSLEISSDVFTPYWLNSYFFLAGLKRDCPDLLESLMDVELLEESERLMRAINFGDFLLAGYFTPSDVSRNALIKISKEISDMYITACDPSSKSNLSQFATFQLLAILNAIFKSQYGYKFFSDTLEELFAKLKHFLTMDLMLWRFSF